MLWYLGKYPKVPTYKKHYSVNTKASLSREDALQGATFGVVTHVMGGVHSEVSNSSSKLDKVTTV